MGYLTLPRLKLLSTAPAVYIDQIEAQESGWVAAQIETYSRKIDARLKKRYAAPFSELPGETPNVVEQWLADILTPRLYRKRGVDAQDEAYLEAAKSADEAWAEVKEAAEAKDGLFELPMKQTEPGASAVTRGAPLGYSEGTPYEAFVNQRERAHDDGVI